MTYIITPLHHNVMNEAALYIDTLTKPKGSLGRLEELAIQLAGITGTLKPDLSPATLVFAADHGITEENVSTATKEVTAQMVINMLNGGAAISVFSKCIAAPITVIDVGVDALLNDPRLVSKKVRPHGTANFTKERAMTLEEAKQAVEIGITSAKDAITKGARCLIIGEVGISNTTPSSAILASILNIDPATVVGRGTGITNTQLKRKINVCKEGLALHKPNNENGFDLLCAVGGLEIAAMAGAIIGGAQSNIPVLLDGFICTVAACIAELLAPNVNDYTILSHQSVEIGHKIAADHLRKQPLVELQLCLGEGTGSAIAYPILKAAHAMLTTMATFSTAAINYE
ncbi:nicotinate-nucleotide--dimethylbenzimidazole phosphoribosyltransferase [Caryophanon latum]|uniref:Nicotinate-nucleotide--dimethylbenzimidazole phosphoribosyltransferase n=1 Tax=Caryophanon latum TaxID=33977 RepID=A0A1C0YBE6_9BACL|nr:nicotinate-nucleotide--dimethylbenzimidazole phosphoribosyltransferase [Caryophanon latum]OCS84449.1 nicotinate-nucleotide--dimethylbenzimidazole phosphoribosyltransferase [Caryophanon latum]